MERSVPTWNTLFLYKIASIAIFISRPVSFVNISCGYADF